MSDRALQPAEVLVDVGDMRARHSGVWLVMHLISAGLFGRRAVSLPPSVAVAATEQRGDALDAFHDAAGQERPRSA